MISVFKKNDLLNFALLLPYTVLLRLYSLINPVAYVPGTEDSVFTTWLLGTVISSPIVQAIVAIVLIYGQAAVINMLTTAHRLYRIPSALSGMCYIVLVSSLKEFQMLTPALIGMTFVILGTFSIFNTYKNHMPKSAILNSAVSGAMAVLIYPPYLVLVLAFMVGLGMMISFDWRSKLQFLIGFGVVFWIIGGVLYTFGWLDWSFMDQIGVVGSMRDIFRGGLTPNIRLLVALLLVVITLFNYYNYKKKKGIDIRKKIDYFYWLLLTGFLSVLFFKELQIEHLMFLALGLSIFIGMSFGERKNLFLPEMIHVLSVVGVFYLHFGV